MAPLWRWATAGLGAAAPFQRGPPLPAAATLEGTGNATSLSLIDDCGNSVENRGISLLSYADDCEEMGSDVLDTEHRLQKRTPMAFLVSVQSTSFIYLLKLSD